MILQIEPGKCSWWIILVTKSYFEFLSYTVLHFSALCFILRHITVSTLRTGITLGTVLVTFPCRCVRNAYRPPPLLSTEIFFFSTSFSCSSCSISAMRANLEYATCPDLMADIIYTHSTQSLVSKVLQPSSYSYYHEWN